MIRLKNNRQIEGIRRSSQLAASVLAATAKLITPGVSTQSLDDFAAKLIADSRAIAAPLGYNGYPKSICTSINNVVCHGIPSSSEILQPGDIINLDITTILDGFYGDVSATFPVGQISAQARELIDVTKECLDTSIKAVKPGKSLNQCVGAVIEPIANRHHYGVVQLLGGHGVGLKFHEDPFVFHYDTNDNSVILRPGMIFTIEPMINGSPNPNVTIDQVDGWTVRTADGSLSAQFEHTILVTPGGAEILTL